MTYRGLLEEGRDVLTRAGIDDADSDARILFEHVTEIGRGAFQRCTGLKEIHIPDSVKEIGMLAFHDCTSLTEVYIPDHVYRYSISPEGLTSWGLRFM